MPCPEDRHLGPETTKFISFDPKQANNLARMRNALEVLGARRVHGSLYEVQTRHDVASLRALLAPGIDRDDGLLVIEPKTASPLTVGFGNRFRLIWPIVRVVAWIARLIADVWPFLT